uniref:Insulin-like domain-containing protein n=1 Tax=Lepeophtheirus salmonis TaxID=72036 RepID=A0A0K2UNB9_LEPSM
MSKKLYFTFFICLLLSMTMGEYSTLESDKYMDPMERLETPSKLEEERMNRESEMILCGHNLFNAWRIACSSIGSKKSLDGFSEEMMMAMNGFRSTMKKLAGLMDQCCSQPCSFPTLLSFC